MSSDNQAAESNRLPPHPLTADRETKRFRHVTHDDVHRWEIMEMRYRNLVEAMRMAINDIGESG